MVTGGGNGLGAATVARLALEGATIIAVDRDAGALEALLGTSQGAVFTHVTDVTDEDGIRDVLLDAVHRYGTVDGLVNFAGIHRDAMCHKMETQAFEEVVRVNLTGSFIVARASAQVMRKAGKGSIVLVSSRAYLGNIVQANYAASKGGVVSLCRTMALELAPFGVRVNALAPGFINAGMTTTVPEKVRRRVLQGIPMGRGGQPSDVASAALFLVSDDASYITGQVLLVDGGRSVGGSLP